MNRAWVMLAIFLVLTFSANAQVSAPTGSRYVYSWTDESGVVHITDRLKDIPSKYRGSIEQSLEQPGQVQRDRERERPSPPSERTSPDKNEAAKAVWQRRIHESEQQLQQAEQRLRELERKKETIIRRWGAVPLAPPSDRMEAERLDDQMKQAKRELEEAKEMLEVVIPEEARKAGVPPGWIRE